MRASNRSTLFLGVSERVDGVSVVATEVDLEYRKRLRTETRTFIECALRFFWQVYSRLSMITSMFMRADTC